MHVYVKVLVVVYLDTHGRVHLNVPVSKHIHVVKHVRVKVHAHVSLHVQGNILVFVNVNVLARMLGGHVLHACVHVNLQV